MEPTNTGSFAGLDQLRMDIEIEHRFKTSISGYDKKDVNAYLEKMQTTFTESKEELERECARLKEENAVLNQKLQDLQREQNIVRLQVVKAQEKAQEKAAQKQASELELTMRESLVNNLRATNERLMKDNRLKQVTITNLEEELETLKSTMSSGTQELFALNNRLSELLSEKINECGDLLKAWQSEVHGVVDVIENRAGSDEELLFPGDGQSQA